MPRALFGLIATVIATTVSAAQQASLLNPSFESTKLHENWTLHVYGAQPTLALDSTKPHQGRQSLRISAKEPSDTALGQEIRLTPGQWYRLTGYVRTDNLNPLTARVYGTFQIQHPGGRGVVATGPNQKGTTDWTQQTLYFTPPGDGLTRIAIFYAGYGKGTGTAWFDDLSIEPVDVAANTITITADPACPGSISPLQYGQFIEYLCAMTPSMFAEKLFDGSFEGVPEYGFVFRKQTDRLEKPWYPDGAVNRGIFALDPANPFNGRLSQRITQKPGDPATLAISQNDIYVSPKEPLRLSVHLRTTNPNATVTATLWAEGKTLAKTEFKPTETWQRCQATLTPSETDAHATFTLSFRGPGSLWVDQISLMPTDTVAGWRRDCADALKALKPGIIRFGGSATEALEWTATIGDPTKRVPFTTCWGGLEPANAGLEEFVQLCEYVKAEPLLCIRFTGKTPKDAADQVEYFNGSPTSPMGRLRAANGHPEPYRVKYWQIGNELGDETYQKGIAAFAKAMKAADPSIKLLASFPSPGLLKNAAEHLDYISPHHYGCDNLPATAQDLQNCREMLQQSAPGRNIRLAITEWNTTAGDWGLDRASLWTLDNALACSRYHNFMHRHCDMIEIANRSNLVDSFCSGIIQTNNHTLYKTPTYYAQELYANHSGQYPLKVQSDSVLASDPMLDISATLSADRQTIAIFVINPTTQPQKRAINLAAFAPVATDVATYTLADTETANERDAANSWQSPARIRTITGNLTLVDNKASHTFAPLSLTVLEIRKPQRQ